MAYASSAEHRIFPPRFEVRGRLGEGGMGIVYEVFDHDSRLPMAAKTLRRMGPEQLYWLKNEFRRLADVHHENLVQLGELFCDASQCFFTMELVRGDDFRTHVRGRDESSSELAGPDDETSTMSHVADSYFTHATGSPISSEFLISRATRGSGSFDEAKLRESLRQLAEAILALHAKGLVHRDLKPSNVIVEPSGRVVVLDFGLADSLRRLENEHADGVYGTAVYMPPEQARKDAVGPSSDWYAFGMMLFNALTGGLPFEGPSAHVLRAKQELDAPRASSLIESCPPDLDELCAALLSRNPSERPDGEEILRRLTPRRTGKSDARARIRQSVFVGRRAELAQLERALQASTEGRFAALLVEGEPGVGKTELVEHFFSVSGYGERPLIVLRGRCYEQEFIPFKGVDALVDSLSRHLKGLDHADALALLPPRLNLVAALFPVLYRVPAVAEVVPPLRVNESRLEHREEAIGQLAQLLTNVARRGRLVAFIDDLQWAGGDSIALLRSLCARADAPPMLLLGTCRTTDRWERDDAGAGANEHLVKLDSTLAALFERVRLSPLSSEDSVTLMRHLWSATDDHRLAQFLEEAGGHPLFLQELARYAGSAGELPRDLRLDQVLRERIARLDSDARRLLEVAAIAGTPLPARVLARVADISRAESVRALRVLRTEQLVRTDTGLESHSVEAYHDRVREAVVDGIRSGEYASALSMDLPRTHLELARQLMRASVEDDVSVASTTLANHLNLGTSAITSAAERADAVRRNLEAARQVKLASAYAASAHYLAAARGHLEGVEGDARRTLERDVDLIEMEVAYLSRDEKRGGAVFAKLIAERRSELDLARAYETRIMVETAQNQLARAVQTAREGLARLSMRFPEKGNDLLLLRDMAMFELRLRGRAPKTLLDLPITEDERVRAQMQILMAMTPAAYFSDPTLMSIAMIRMATLSLDGLTVLSAYGFIGYALVLCAGFQKYRRAFEFSTLAIALNERFQNRALDAKIAHLHYFNCGTYVMDFEQCKPGLRQVQELGLANGDLNFRTYGAICTPMITFCAGEPLEVMKAECESGVRVAEQEGNVDMAGQTHLRLRAIRCLEGVNPDALSLDAPSSPESDFLHSIEEAKLPTSLFAYGMMKAVLGVHFERPEIALEGAERALAYGHAQFGLITHIDLALYQTLAACAVIERSTDRARKKELLAIASGNVKRLQKWAESHPRNFGCHHPLALGELARVSGQPAKARTELEAALARAEAKRHHSIAALAHERLAAWHRSQANERRARAELQRAIEAYRRWGAHARVQQLADRLG